MGRSVSVPHSAVCVAYRDISDLGLVAEVDENDNETGENVYDDLIGQIEFDNLVDWITEQATGKWKSMHDARDENRWLDREDRVLAYNGLAYLGCSSYGCVMSIWLVPMDYDDTYDESTESLAKHWCEQVSTNFQKMFGDIVRVGGFSDGTSVYERKQA